MDRVPLREVQRNILFSNETKGRTFKAPSATSSNVSSVSPPPPTLTVCDLLKDAGYASRGPAASENDNIWSFNDWKDCAGVDSGCSKPPTCPPTACSGAGAAQLPANRNASPIVALTPAPAFTSNSFFDANQTRPAAATTWGDILMWEDVVKTGILFVAGLIVLTVLDHVVRGDHNVTIVSGTASMGLVFIAFHFIASLFVTDHRQLFGLSSDDRSRAMGDWIHSCVHRFSITYDSLMIADDYRTTLKVAFAFWALTVIGHVLSLWTILWLAYVGIFMFPITWAHFGSRISARVASWKSRVATRVKYAGLTRTHAVVIQCLLALSMWLHSGLASQMTIILVFTIAARCQLHPQEVEKLKSHVEPMSANIKKTASRMQRYLASYTPHRKQI